MEDIGNTGKIISSSGTSLSMKLILLINVKMPLIVGIFKHSVLHKKLSQAFNSHVLTGKNPCINQVIHVLLMHSFYTLQIRILGRHRKFINSNEHRNERYLVTLG